MSPVHSLEWNYIETGEPVSPQRSAVTPRGRGRGGEEPRLLLANPLKDTKAVHAKKKRSLHPLFLHRRCPNTRRVEPPGGRLEVLTSPRAKVKCADGDAIKVYAGRENGLFETTTCSLVLLLLEAWWRVCGRHHKRVFTFVSAAAKPLCRGGVEAFLSPLRFTSDLKMMIV